MSGATSVDPTLRSLLVQHTLREEDDTIVCAFGPDFFRGARDGAAIGGAFSTACCYWSFRRLKKDQAGVNADAGLKRGQRHPHLSSWTLLRGIRTQPMLTVGCIAMACTSVFKCIKFSLASRRCREFARDEEEFTTLLQASRTTPEAAAAFDKLCEGALSSTTNASLPPPSSSAGDAASSQAVMDALLRSAGTVDRVTRRPPSFMDGFAVGITGSIMDCYVPQKPLPKYYGMRLGMA